SRDDGLELHDVYVMAAVRCAPPANKPTLAERDTCRPFLVRELRLLDRVRVLVMLGAFAYEATWRVLPDLGIEPPRPRPRFGHGVEVGLGPAAPTIVCSFHPSQQNTFTGRLTPAMFDAIFARAGELAG